VIQVKDAYLVEYRFPGVMRVIACCFDSQADAPHQGLVLLLTITLDHDHDRMKRLIRQSSAAIVQEGQAALEQDPGGPSEPP
jgi:hypothetical protein